MEVKELEESSRADVERERKTSLRGDTAVALFIGINKRKVVWYEYELFTSLVRRDASKPRP